MLNSQVRFHAANGKRQILVADDEMINREILGHLLQADYEVLFAENGREALDLARENRDTLSLVLLDLLMPVMSGMEVLQEMKSDPALEQLPVIVVTSDQSAEIASLGVGAADFISKPYPQPGVILARVRRTIELSEDRQIILSTERDPLTGLYNREYFYRYAEQLDQHHKHLEMDAIVLDVNHFHVINERHGKAYGDAVLRHIGESVRSMVSESGGIVCRREADTFMVYCPHRMDYRDILENASEGLDGEGSGSRVRLRMGVYAVVDKSIDIERRFDRAKSASDTVRNNYSKAIGIYDDALRRQELYEEQLIDDFRAALRDRQFVVFYQPKFDIRPDIPVLSSAEALVRWKHPNLGMISPGVFIPLFEENGLIQELDEYVWRTAAAQIRDWRNRFGISVPVSVNVSRIDMYDPNLIATFQSIMAEYGLTPKEFLLEITESAYTEDSAQIISTVNRLRALGFQIEMDDFGTGYSSLNMISSLPIDALKLDMKFIRNAFRDGKDTRLIEVIIDIADYLEVPVIAEGVETEEQLMTLKAMGCDIVQGYYFSKPVPPEEYECFVEARRRVTGASAMASRARTKAMEPGERAAAYSDITQALTRGFESIYYVDATTGTYVQFSGQGRYEDLQIERSGSDFFGDTQRNIERVVWKPDRERVALSMAKEALLQQLMGGQAFSMTYRLEIEGKPVYYNLRAVNANTRDEHHIVIGISNVEDQFKEAMETGVSPEKSREFLSIAHALSNDFESIYYVDLRNDNYSEFTAQGAYEDLKIELSGVDFFADCQRNLQTVVYEEDRAKVSEALKKENLLRNLSRGKPFKLTYRLLMKGEPIHYRMKVVRVKDDINHIVIGVSNNAAQMLRQYEYEAAKAENVTFATIAQALAVDYFSIYYVDANTDRFIEFSAHEEYQMLNIEKSGEDFFNLSRRNILRVAAPEDHEKVLMAFTKENLMRELEHSGTFTLTHRLMFDGVPTYVNLKATRMANNHIVIGVANVDAQMQRERELNEAREKANRDALTGVKSKHAYLEVEARMDKEIKEGYAAPFAVAVCDVNGLKVVNDTLGHAAGDQLIRDASAIICNIFKHSPVFRIGGDEFVAILRGQDYDNRQVLMAEMAGRNRRNRKNGGVIIAGGLSEYQPGVDGSLSPVFKRADDIMYQNKRQLKEQG